MLLRMDGHDVTVVHDGRQAVSTIDSFRPEIAVLDIGMPELNGYEVARQVRQGPLGTLITLIAVTGWGRLRTRRAPPRRVSTITLPSQSSLRPCSRCFVRMDFRASSRC